MAKNGSKNWVVDFYLDNSLVATGNIEASSKDVAEMNAEIEMMTNEYTKQLDVKWNKVVAEELVEDLGEFGDDEGW